MRNGPGHVRNKVAFVLSGGANRGALEVGALLALFENGIRPDILVGRSIGAINATAIAMNPTLEGARWLADVWREAAKKTAVLPIHYIAMVWRFITGQDGLASNSDMKRFIQRHMPEGIRTYGDLKNVELYVTAVNIETAELHIFGMDPSESLLDGMMASSAVPACSRPGNIGASYTSMEESQPTCRREWLLKRAPTSSSSWMLANAANTGGR